MSQETTKFSPNRELVSNWIDALLSGEYKQGIGCLRAANNSYCCLGVLTEVAAKMGMIDGEWEEGHTADMPEGYVYNEEGKAVMFQFDFDEDQPDCEGWDCGPEYQISCYAFVTPLEQARIQSDTIVTQDIPIVITEMLGMRMSESGSMPGLTSKQTFTMPDGSTQSYISLAAANDFGVPFTSIAQRVREIFADVLEEEPVV